MITICVTIILVVVIVSGALVFETYMEHCSRNGVGMFEYPIQKNRRIQRLEKCIERLEKILETEEKE